MPNFKRIDRITQEVKKELSLIIRELKDPRIPLMTSVVNVKVANDLKVAKAYISVMGDEKAKNDCLAALKNAAGFIRREIGSRVDLRYTPEFTFVLDDSIEYGSHISEVLKNL